MRIVCPLCQSHHSERLALTYAKGISKGTSHSIGGGVAAGFGGALFALFLPLSIPFFALQFLGFIFMMRTWTHDSTLLAIESRPPKRLSYSKVTFMAIAFVIASFFLCGWFVSGLLHSTNPEGQHGSENLIVAYSIIGIGVAVWLAIAIGGVIIGVRAARYFIDVVWAKKEAGWQRSFLCKRCGAHFLVVDYDPIGVNVVRSDKIGTGNYLPHAETEEQRLAVEAKFQSDHKNLRKKDPWL